MRRACQAQARAHAYQSEPELRCTRAIWHNSSFPFCFHPRKCITDCVPTEHAQLHLWEYKSPEMQSGTAESGLVKDKVASASSA